MNHLNPLLNQAAIAGNTQFGSDVAQKAVIGTGIAKQLNPNNGIGLIGPGAGNWLSPSGGLSGEIAIPQSILPPDYFTITLDTTGETEDTEIVLFDPKNLYKNQNCGTCTDAALGGCVYSGSKECDKYDSIVNMLCSNQYLLHTMRAMVLDSTNSSGSLGLALQTRFKIWQGNINDDVQQTSFRLSNHISPKNFTNDIVDVVMSDRFSLLDQFTAWIVSVPAGTLMELTFFITARKS